MCIWITKLIRTVWNAAKKTWVSFRDDLLLTWCAQHWWLLERFCLVLASCWCVLWTLHLGSGLFKGSPHLKAHLNHILLLRSQALLQVHVIKKHFFLYSVYINSVSRSARVNVNNSPQPSALPPTPPTKTQTHEQLISPYSAYLYPLSFSFFHPWWSFFLLFHMCEFSLPLCFNWQQPLRLASGGCLADTV